MLSAAAGEPGEPPAGPPTLSPDGRHAAWLAADAGGTRLVLWDVAEGLVHAALDVPAARVRSFTWTFRPGTGLAVADRTGDESWQLLRVDLADGRWSPVQAAPGAQVQLVATSPARPDTALVAVNERDARWHDHELLDLASGRRTPALRNEGYAAVYADRALRPRLVETADPDGGRTLWHGPPERGARYLHVPHRHALGARVTGFSADGTTCYAVLPAGDDRVELVALRCTGGAPAARRETLLSVRGADLDRVLVDAAGRPALVEVERHRPRVVALDPALRPALARLRARLGDEPRVLERRDGGRVWLVVQQGPVQEPRHLVHEPATGRLVPLGSPRAARSGRGPLACRPASIPLRGGLRAPAYVTSPGSPATGGPVPGAVPGAAAGAAVLLVHGGPWRRSRWEHSPRRAALAAQGYTVVEPNYRGSTGLGSAWVGAADRQWGAAMQDDLEDALDWAVRAGVADAGAIALVGGSYGGYAVLQLAATSGRPFRGVVASSPVTDLVAFLESLPPAWHSARPMLRRRVGDPDDPAQRRALAAASPVHHAGRIGCPVLLVHGLADPRVPAGLTGRMFMALAEAGRDATVALFPDEGHELAGSRNRAVADGLVAAFLARHLAGRAADDPEVAGSSVRLLHSPGHGRRAGAAPRREVPA